MTPVRDMKFLAVWIYVVELQCCRHLGISADGADTTGLLD